MVIESLVGVQRAEKRPITMFMLSFLYATVAVFIGLWIFPNYAGLTMVFFTVMALIPIMLRMINYEESKIFIKTIGGGMHHKDAIPFFVFMFLGTVAAFTFWFTIFPERVVDFLFQIQISTIEQINHNISSGFNSTYFIAIILNNLRVLFFVLLFSFIYGAGAIFILTWNASIIAVAIGNTAREIVSNLATSVGSPAVGNYFHAVSLSSLRYLVHGIPEIGAYFVAGLAGGMISVAVIKYDLFDAKFNKVVWDSLYMVLLSAALLFGSAVVEVFVSPYILA